MTDFLLLAGWLLAIWFAAHWYSERDRATLAEYDAAMLIAQLRAASEVIDARDSALRNANDYINKLLDERRIPDPNMLLKNFEDGRAYYYVEN